jgi:hypothetical protein
LTVSRPLPPAPDLPPDRGRRLGGHLFLPSEQVPGPFVLTGFGSRTGAALQSLSYAQGDGTPGDLSAFSLSQGFALGLALLPRWGVEFAGGGGFFSAQDSAAAFQSGLEGSYQLEGSTRLVVLDGRRLRVALQAWVGGGKDYAVDIGPALNDVEQATHEEVQRLLEEIRAGRLDVNSPTVREQLRQRLMAPVNEGLQERDLLVSRQHRVLGGGLQLAAAPARLLGLVGSLDLAHLRQECEPADSRDTPTELSGAQLRAGLLLSLDLQPVSPLPLGLSLLYQHRRLLQGEAGAGSSRSGDTWGGGLAYTGRENLGLGLETTALLEEGSSSLNGTLRLWYYW